MYWLLQTKSMEHSRHSAQDLVQNYLTVISLKKYLTFLIVDNLWHGAGCEQDPGQGPFNLTIYWSNARCLGHLQMMTFDLDNYLCVTYLVVGQKQQRVRISWRRSRGDISWCRRCHFWVMIRGINKMSSIVNLIQRNWFSTVHSDCRIIPLYPLSYPCIIVYHPHLWTDTMHLLRNQAGDTGLDPSQCI